MRQCSRRNLLRAAATAAGAVASAPLLAAQGLVPTWGAASDAERPIQIINFDWLEQAARQVLPPASIAFLGPAGDGWTYRENRRAFDDYVILPRRLQGIDEGAVDLRVNLLGHQLLSPLITAPVGRQAVIHIEGEVASARGTGAAGALFVASGASSRTMDEIAAATDRPKWFQIYLLKDEAINRWLVQRAKVAGYSGIVLTADALGPGQSDEFIKLGQPFPPGTGPGNHDPARGGRGNFAERKTAMDFRDITRLRDASGLPVIVKGLLHVDDVRRSLGAGAQAVWVSNHGGRQIDAVPASASVLPNIVDAVDGRAPVILDSGVRRGTDVLKALALGATAVAIGRPVVWAVALGGSVGVKEAHAHLNRELKSAMLLSGVARVTDLKRSHLMVQRTHEISQ